MEKNFPCPIVSEKDLNYYESYLKKCGEAKVKAAPPAVSSAPCRITDILKKCVGKLVRVESLIGGRLEIRVGTLLEVGADYLILKLYRGCSTMICELSSVKYVTVIHDNDINKTGLF